MRRYCKVYRKHCYFGIGAYRQEPTLLSDSNLFVLPGDPACNVKTNHQCDLDRPTGVVSTAPETQTHTQTHILHTPITHKQTQNVLGLFNCTANFLK